MKVISLDPGVTTGYCVANIEDPAVVLNYSQAKWTELELFGMLEDAEPDFIVYESFEYRPGKARMGLNLAPTELIGVNKLYAQMVMPPGSLYVQSASTGKAFYTDEKIKALDLYDAKHKHGRDALRHMLQWLTFGPGFNLVKEPMFLLMNP